MKITKIGWTLCILSALGLMACFAFVGLNSSHAPDDKNSLTFIKPGAFKTASYLAVISTASLFGLLLYCIVKKDKQALTLVWLLALSLSLYPAAKVLMVPVAYPKLFSWKVKEHIKGSDYHTYYLLYAAPPLGQDGRGAVARRTGGNFLYYTMRIIVTEYPGNHTSVLDAGLEDPDPHTRRTCRMLLDTIKRRSAARQNAR